MDGVDHGSVNLDLDSLDFKSSESVLKKDSPDQKSGFGFSERNAKSVFGFTERNTPKVFYGFASARAARDNVNFY